MSDPMPPDDLHPDDELVSAVLDGEATPEEVARVERDPVLAARLVELRSVAAAVADPVEPLSPAAVDDLVAVALAAAASGPDPSPTDQQDEDDGPVGAPVVALVARRTTDATLRWVAVAAVVLVALAVPLALALRPTDRSETFASVGSAVDESSATEGGAAADASSEEDATAGAAGGDTSSRAVEAEASTDAAPTTTMSSAPPGPASADAVTAWSTVPWLGDLGTVAEGPDIADRLADRVAAALPGSVPASTAPYDSPQAPTPVDEVRQAATECAADLAPGSALLGVGVVVFDRGDVRSAVAVIVVGPPGQPPSPAGAQVLVVAPTAGSPLGCGELVDAAALPG